ncbi:MAG: bifunctional methylenetetrahydrofolate dehydrogenase/methenyltetrahydrofolate cyclohydrolase FolD [Deltaproteobacteria bacterium]|nr:bifunctional methylenetetrahydrofolate dehydrogenase/methenyltetrahydrofolate cyclohydrolase FolD [Deltaproteobacteria bacterium]
MGTILNGKAVAQTVRQSVKDGVAGFVRQHGQAPGLATVLIGDDPVSRVYVGTKEKACREVGLQSFAYRLPATVAAAEAFALVAELNARTEVHGILLQLPLPEHLPKARLIESLAPEKDVDALHPLNQGRLLLGEAGLRPCTPLGVMRLLDEGRVPLAGKRAVVIGRSLLVGKPVALMLLERHATVTCCHSYTAGLAAEVCNADVVVAALGQPETIKGAWIKEGAIVIDVGISRLADGSLRGDVEFAAAKERAAFITPVPGGVGPMTVAMLLANTLKAAEQQRQSGPSSVASGR